MLVHCTYVIELFRAHNTLGAHSKSMCVARVSCETQPALPKQGHKQLSSACRAHTATTTTHPGCGRSLVGLVVQLGKRFLHKHGPQGNGATRLQERLRWLCVCKLRLGLHDRNALHSIRAAAAVHLKHRAPLTTIEQRHLQHVVRFCHTGKLPQLGASSEQPHAAQQPAIVQPFLTSGTTTHTHTYKHIHT